MIFQLGDIVRVSPKGERQFQAVITHNEDDNRYGISLRYRGHIIRTDNVPAAQIELIERPTEIDDDLIHRHQVALGNRPLK